MPCAVKVVGAGHSSVAVSADVDTSKVEQTVTTVTPVDATHWTPTSVQNVTENYGHLRVSESAGGKALPKVYVKVYAKLADGSVKFHKDGYTDIRGRFDYASVNTPERRPVDNLLGYNSGVERPRGGHAAGGTRVSATDNYWVGDLTLECEADLGVLSRVLDLVREAAARTGREVRGLPELEAETARVKTWLEGELHTWPWVESPMRPLDPEIIAQSRASIARGEGEYVEDILNWLKAGGPLIQE